MSSKDSPKNKARPVNLNGGDTQDLIRRKNCNNGKKPTSDPTLGKPTALATAICAMSPSQLVASLCTFTCFGCRKEEQSDVKAEASALKDKGKNERDDEEEFYRIPIAGERESDYAESLTDLLGDLSDLDNEWIYKDKEDKQASNNIAFVIGPNVEGRVMAKSLPLLHSYLHLNPYTAIFEEDSKYLPTELPTWSAVLLQYQRACLQQRYKRLKKKRMKLMKKIRRKVPKVDPIPTRQSSQQVSDEDPDKQALPFLQMVRRSELYLLILQWENHHNSSMHELCIQKQSYWTEKGNQGKITHGQPIPKSHVTPHPTQKQMAQILDPNFVPNYRTWHARFFHRNRVSL
jgi:hypothetical protein